MKEFRNKRKRGTKGKTASITLVMPLGRFRLNDKAIELLKFDYTKQGLMFLLGKDKIKIKIEETKEPDNYHLNKVNVFSNQNLGFQFVEVFGLKSEGTHYFKVGNDNIIEV